MLTFLYSKDLLQLRKWDQLLKFSEFNPFCHQGFSSGRVSLTVSSPEDEFLVIKGLDFLSRLLPFLNPRSVILFKTKKYNSSAPLQFFITLRGPRFFDYFLNFFTHVKLAKQRHTFFSYGLAPKSITFSLGNLSELSFSLNSSFDYFKWSSVLDSSFFLKRTYGSDAYYMSIFGFPRRLNEE